MLNSRSPLPTPSAPARHRIASRRRPVQAVLASAALLVPLVVTVLPASAASADSVTQAASAPVTVSFGSGANQPFVVPSGVTQLTVTATGAGGQNGDNGGAGGTGATVTGDIPATPGATLFVNVAT